MILFYLFQHILVGFIIDHVLQHFLPVDLMVKYFPFLLLLSPILLYVCKSTFLTKICLHRLFIASAVSQSRLVLKVCTWDVLVLHFFTAVINKAFTMVCCIIVEFHYKKKLKR